VLKDAVQSHGSKLLVFTARFVASACIGTNCIVDWKWQD
jgi:hypothetical protein